MDDLISNLPLYIIHIILEGVPIKDAVKTSLLSRQWRYIWATLPHLTFDYTYIDSSSKDKLIKFVDQVLFLHQGPIVKVEMRWSKIEASYLDRWLLFLCRNGIRTLTLGLNRVYSHKLHSSLYSCQNLIDLQLDRCDLLTPPPTFNGFLCLRRLALINVGLDSNTLERLVGNCPLLEDFMLAIYPPASQLKIRAPNLKCLLLEGGYEDISVYAPLLSKLTVDFSSKDSVYTNLFDSFPILEELVGGRYFIEYLNLGNESLMFHHLRKLELHPVFVLDILSVVPHFMKGFPILEELKLTFYLHSPYYLPLSLPTISPWDPEREPNFVCELLKVIEMVGPRDKNDELELIKFLLASSPLLDKMIFRPRSYVSKPEIRNLMVEVLTYPRASPNAQIIII